MNTSEVIPRSEESNPASLSFVVVIILIIGGTISLLLPQMYSVALIFLCFGFGIGFFNIRISILVALSILIYIAGEIQIIFTGITYVLPSGKLNLHLLTYFIFGAFLGMITSKPARLKMLYTQSVFFKTQTKWIVWFVVLEIGVELLNFRGVGLSNQFPDVYIGPFLFYWFIVVCIAEDDNTQRVIENWAIFITIPLVFLGIIEYFKRENLFFDTIYRNQCTWYAEYQFELSYGVPYRITTFLGHPLINSIYFCSLSLFALIRSRIFNRKENLIYPFLIAGILFSAGLLLTLSRAASFLWIVAIFILAYYGRQGKHKITNLLAIFGILAVLLIFLSPVVGNLFERKLDDSSANTRYESIGALATQWQEISIIGHGSQSVDEIKVRVFGILTGGNLEVGWLIVLIQFGLIFLVAYFIIIFIPIKAAFARKRLIFRQEIFPYAMIVCMLILLFATNNSIGERYTLNYFFFYCSALLTGRIIRLDKKYLIQI